MNQLFVELLESMNVQDTHSVTAFPCVEVAVSSIIRDAARQFARTESRSNPLLGPMISNASVPVVLGYAQKLEHVVDALANENIVGRMYIEETEDEDDHITKNTVVRICDSDKILEWEKSSPPPGSRESKFIAYNCPLLWDATGVVGRTTINCNALGGKSMIMINFGGLGSLGELCCVIHPNALVVREFPGWSPFEDVCAESRLVVSSLVKPNQYDNGRSYKHIVIMLHKMMSERKVSITSSVNTSADVLLSIINIPYPNTILVAIRSIDQGDLLKTMADHDIIGSPACRTHRGSNVKYGQWDGKCVQLSVLLFGDGDVKACTSALFVCLMKILDGKI